jgi:hypothetical protein
MPDENTLAKAVSDLYMTFDEEVPETKPSEKEEKKEEECSGQPSS